MKKLTSAWAIGAVAGLAAWGMHAAGWLDRIEYVTWTWRVRRVADPSPWTERIKVIFIDQKSLEWGKKENGLGWPWPRSVQGYILDFCMRGGAKAVAYDMIYTESSMDRPDDDQVFGQSIARSECFVGAVSLGRQDEELSAWPEDIPDGLYTNAPPADWQRRYPDLTARLATFPIKDVVTNAVRLGNVGAMPDDDGVFRRYPLAQIFDGRAVPSLALAAWQTAAQADEEPAAVQYKDGALVAGTRRIPLDARGHAILRFRGGSGAHQALSAAAILQSEQRIQEGATPTIDPATFKDCFVLVGATARGLMDLRPAPMSKVYPGVELHATALDNLLAGDFFRPFPPAPIVFAGHLAVALAGAVLVIFTRRAAQSGVALALAIAIPVAAGFAAAWAGTWWPIAGPALAALLAGAGALLYNYATEGRQKAFIKHAFQYYLGPAVIDQIIDDPSRLQLGGEKRALTLFFSDIEGFSSFSERLPPPTLTALLNEFLSEMSGIIMDEGGYLDKYIGDAIVAFWNAPLPQEDHAVRAVRSALRCQRRLADVRAALQEKYGALVKMRVGLNTGEVVVGNMGSADRMNYTVLGDAANLASRLEGANKAFGTFILASESTWAATGGRFVGRELGRLRVLGRSAPLTVFEPVGFAGDPAPAHFAPFAEALKLFYAGRFAEAEAAFRSMPDDPASRTHADRCARFQRTPPAAWDGVIGLTEK